MICRSCGNTYDYDYFAEENLLKAADKTLAHKNFYAAKDMYEFMLDKEPSNLKALKGLLLAKNNVVRLYDITQKMKDGTFSIASFDLEKYRNNSDPGVAGFFKKTDRILDLYKRYVPLKKDLKKLEDEAGDSEPEYMDSSNGVFYYASDDALKKTVRVALIVLVILAVIFLAFRFNSYTPSWLTAMLILAAIVTAVIIMAAFLEMLSNKKKDKQTEISESEKTKAGIREKNGEIDRILDKINDVLKELNTY